MMVFDGMTGHGWVLVVACVVGVWVAAASVVTMLLGGSNPARTVRPRPGRTAPVVSRGDHRGDLFGHAR